ncbi:hypothetical protein N0V94_005680 [Neodidymelliopsis sp. IMI 364377]|nr:hypothetical protein N0V94_005680 [Neodidymelliopsis sp. IMI 364377]
MAKHPDPVPVYFLLILALLLCAYFVWLCSVAVRLYIYKDALAPEPERFVILPAYLRNRSVHRGHHRHVTAFSVQAPTKSPARELARLSRVPRIRIADLDAGDLPDPEIRAFLVEQQRISRLPAFVQDDCGDGTEFPDIPLAITPVGASQDMLAPSGVRHTPSANYKYMGLKKVDQHDWLVVDDTYKDYHCARDSVLSTKNAECIQVTRDGEDASEELLQEISEYLVSRYPGSFEMKMINRRKHIRNKETKEEWSLVRPFDCHPLELCARLGMEDFNVLVKGDFTQQYYLQASATIFPAGWRMRGLIGKPLSYMKDQDIYQWDAIPDILAMITSTISLARSTLYIQTQPDARPLAALMFIQEPKDFFPGNLSSLLPQHIIIRREHQILRRLPKTGAIVFSTRTELKNLTELDVHGRRDLVNEIRGWDREVATTKGLELWQRTVFGWCEGKREWESEDNS